MNRPSCCLRYAHALINICVPGPRGLVGLVFHSCYPPIVGIRGNVTGAVDVAIHHYCNVDELLAHTGVYFQSGEMVGICVWDDPMSLYSENFMQRELI